MSDIDYNKHIYEGWRVIDFINNLKPLIEEIMEGDSYIELFNNRKALAKFCADNQPYYKKVIPEVVDYFCSVYNIN